jgi:hypothetical protein
MSNPFPPLAAPKTYARPQPRTQVVPLRLTLSLPSAELLCLAALGLVLALG